MNKSQRIRVSWLAVAAVAALVSVAALVPWGDGEGTAPRTVEIDGVTLARPELPNDLPAMRAFIDEETGELRAPTADEAAAIAEDYGSRQSLQRRSAPATIQRPDGTVVAQVPLELMEFSVARVGADGELDLKWVDGSEVGTALTASVPSPEPTDR